MYIDDNELIKEEIKDKEVERKSSTDSKFWIKIID